MAIATTSERLDALIENILTELEGRDLSILTAAKLSALLDKLMSIKKGKAVDEEDEIDKLWAEMKAEKQKQKQKTPKGGTAK